MTDKKTESKAEPKVESEPAPEAAPAKKAPSGKAPARKRAGGWVLGPKGWEIDKTRGGK